ncbi:MAG: ABC transporter permease [Synergistaceae bacterium]|jgi:simple sugar transport system permease protein|nr:ABC transporter permease [Synergistaceae bacterium]
MSIDAKDAKNPKDTKRGIKPASSKIFSPLLALFAILLFNIFLNPGFLSITIVNGHLYGQLIDILNRAVPVMILATGMTLVIATAGTDLSCGALLALSGALAVSLIRGDSTVLNADTAMPFAAVILISLVVTSLCGLWNGFLVAKLGIQPIVATLIFMTAGRGIAQLITGARNLTTSYEPFSVIGQGWFLGLPVPLFIAAGVFLAVWYFARRTAFGLFVEAVGVNASAARYSGINSSLVIMVVYTISGFCAGVAGLIYASNIMCADATNAGLNYELDAILAVVLGGTSMMGGRFYLGGTVIGALIIMALTKSIYAFDVAPESALVVKAFVVVFVVMIQSPLYRSLRESLRSRKRKPGSVRESVG